MTHRSPSNDSFFMGIVASLNHCLLIFIKNGQPTYTIRHHIQLEYLIFLLKLFIQEFNHNGHHRITHSKYA